MIFFDVVVSSYFCGLIRTLCAFVPSARVRFAVAL